jgi:hypothetical protein
MWRTLMTRKMLIREKHKQDIKVSHTWTCIHKHTLFREESDDVFGFTAK